MGDSFAKQHCRAVVCHIMQCIGFHNAWSIPIDGLACLLAERIYTISKAVAFFCHAFNRTEPILDDVGLVFSWMGISLSEIVDYLNQVEMVSPIHAVPRFPVERPMKLPFCLSGADNEQRAAYVPEFIPLLAPSEITKQEKATIDEPAEIHKSLQVASEQQACRTSLLSQLEKLDAFSAGLVAYAPPQVAAGFNEPLDKVKEEPAEVEQKLPSSPIRSSSANELFEQPLTIVETQKPTVNKVPPFRIPKAEPKKARRVKPAKPPSLTTTPTTVSASRRRDKVEWGHIKDVICEVLEQATKKHKGEETVCVEDAGPPCPLRDIYDNVLNDTFHATPPAGSSAAAIASNKVTSVAKKPKKPIKQEKGETFAQIKIKPLVIPRAGMDQKSGMALSDLDVQAVAIAERETTVALPVVEKENEPTETIVEKSAGEDGNVPTMPPEDNGSHNPLRITLKLSSLQFSKEKKKKKKAKDKGKLSVDVEQRRPTMEVAQTTPGGAVVEEKKVPKLILKLPTHNQGKVKKEKTKRANPKLAKNARTVVEPLTVITDELGGGGCPSSGPSSSRHSGGSKALHSPSSLILPSPIPPTPSPGSSSHNSPLHVDMSPVNKGDSILNAVSQCTDNNAATAPVCSLVATSSPKRAQQSNSDWYCPVCFKGDREDVDMVCCDSCNCWFHYDCVGLEAAPSTPAWFCQRCTDLPKGSNLTIK
ncbi:Transcription initiation factor TFIID subunit 3 [Trichuris trichiura]|uniref:Transcription initiation factor TFIID subunit 3 n=1 Tax=Trichuris trichiura TaxID=36087 RepID=A0A077ZII5_TRITR|nr:Transcription initiation factor TFIID subunit 3 [Trichuris trichiura]